MGTTESRVEPLREWLTRKQAADYLASLGYSSISAKSLANMASNNNAGKGPPFTRIGWKTVRYEKSDLKKWLEARVERIC